MSPRTGRPKSNNRKSNRVTFRLDDEDYSLLESYAEAKNRSKTDILIEAISKFLEDEIMDNVTSIDDFEEVNDDMNDEMMTRSDMLKEMEDKGFPMDDSEEADDDDVKAAYDEMMEELEDTSDTFPNGRDFDAEDEDGPS